MESNGAGGRGLENADTVYEITLHYIALYVCARETRVRHCELINGFSLNIIPARTKEGSDSLYRAIGTLESLLVL